MVFVTSPVAAYCAAGMKSTDESVVKSHIVEKSIDMIIDIPQQLHIPKAFRRTTIYTKMYNTDFEAVPDTDTFIREIKKELDANIQFRIKEALEEVTSLTECPIDLIGFSVTFREPVRYYTKGE